MPQEKVAYLLPHIGVPSNFHPPSRTHIVQSNKAAKAMGITVLRVGIHDGPAHSPNGRYFFRFPWFRRDDQEAVRITECVLYGVAISFGPMGGPDIRNWIFLVPWSLIQGKRRLDLDQLVQGAQSLSGIRPLLESTESMVASVSYIAHYRVAAAWAAAGALFQRRNLYQAARFFYSSQQTFHVFPGEISEIASATDQFSESGWEQTRLESVLLDSFRTIEAVIGDPPKSDRKFNSKLRAIGIDPADEVGYGAKAPIADVIRRMNRARDKKSAHGAPIYRDISVADALEYQACAHLILVVGIERFLGEELW